MTAELHPSRTLWRRRRTSTLFSSADMVDCPAPFGVGNHNSMRAKHLNSAPGEAGWLKYFPPLRLTPRFSGRAPRKWECSSFTVLLPDFAQLVPSHTALGCSVWFGHRTLYGCPLMLLFVPASFNELSESVMRPSRPSTRASYCKWDPLASEADMASCRCDKTLTVRRSELSHFRKRYLFLLWRRRQLGRMRGRCRPA
jgi:hypothetical protein